MKRPLCVMMMAFVFGVITVIWDKGIVIAIAGIIVIISINIIRRDRVLLCLLMIFVFISTGYLLARHYDVYLSEYEEMDKGMHIKVGGIVYRTDKKEYSTNLFVKMSNGKKVIVKVIELKEEIYSGMNILIEGEVGSFNRATNEGNFDEQLYYNSLGILGIIEDSKIIESRNHNQLQIKLEHCKMTAQQIIANITDERTSSVIKAMLLGDRSQLDEHTSQLYYIAGIRHIISISGLHISLLGMVIYNVLRKITNKKVATIISIFIIILFAIMTGGAVSTIRAVIMYSVSLLAKILGRTYDAISGLSLAVILLLIEDPFYILNSGFQMSALAVVGIAVINPIITEFIATDSRLIKSILFTLGIQIVMLPVIVWNFYEIPIYGVIANIFLVPLVGIILINSIIATLIGILSVCIARILILPSFWILVVFEKVCAVISKMPYAVVVVGKPSEIQILIYYCILSIVTLIMWLQIKKRDETYIRWWWTRYSTNAFCVVATCILIAVICIRNRKGLEITMLDVGQGECIFVRDSSGKVLLIDAGSTSQENVGKYKIEPFLKAKGVDTIDYAIITHPDKDHYSGFVEFAINESLGININNILIPSIEEDSIYRELIEKFTTNDINVVHVSQGLNLARDGWELRVLHPSINFTSDNINDYSITMCFEYKGFSMLFTGDITEEVEDILEQNGYLMGVDALKVAHHGSKYSSGERLLEKVKADAAIISAGINNIYGHPHKETLQRLCKYNIDIFGTYKGGAITIKVNHKGYEIEQFVKKY